MWRRPFTFSLHQPCKLAQFAPQEVLDEHGAAYVTSYFVSSKKLMGNMSLSIVNEYRGEVEIS